MSIETNEKYLYEVKILNFWKDNKIFTLLKSKAKNKPLFITIDGPPYPTGEVHIGHIRNWAIKDAVIRYKWLTGYNVEVRDGYDVQGLPIENKVQAKLNIKTSKQIKQMGIKNFINECRIFVDEVIDTMSEIRDRYALTMNRDYYYTSNPDYISFAWKFFKIADEKKLLYKDYKTVAWCPTDETTLSDYEIKDTYKNLDDPSIYVKFPIKKEDKKTPYTESFLIWTTTPWTLQSNMAIVVNPDFEYSWVLVDFNKKEEVFVIAKLLIENVLEFLNKSNNVKFVEILKTMRGSELEGMSYNHIYLDETPSQKEFIKQDINFLHKILLGDFVTLGEGEDILDKLEKKNFKHEKKEIEILEDTKENIENIKTNGTGLVHCAPGHGFDDFTIGKKYGLPIFCPIDSRGIFIEGIYKNKYFKDVDKIAIDYLKKKGFLIHNEIKNHRYPCCWRCKTPIVYRATTQWWIARSKIIKQMIKENSDVNWTPHFARENFNHLLAGAGDWAISRQRFWGTPLPIFEDEDGNYKVYGSKQELEKDINKKLDDIHLDNLQDLIVIDSKTKKEFKHVNFVADVWFDSGAASFASYYDKNLTIDEIIKKYYPIDWITEGQDQMRGWFSSLFNVGFILTGKKPYKNVLYQQFVMSIDGTKMSKSLGNGFTGAQGIENWGSDRTRYYLLMKKVPEEQINFNPKEFDIVNGFFNTFENSFKFTNEYIKTFNFLNVNLNYNKLEVEDKWILYRLNITLREYSRLILKFRFNLAIFKLEEFISDFSKVYLKIIRERTLQRDESLCFVFNSVFKNSLLLLTPISPFFTENMYQNYFIFNKKESIMFEEFKEADEFLIRQIEKEKIKESFDISQEIIQAILNAREKVKIGIRWPLSKINILSFNNFLSSDLKPFEKLIKQITNIKKIDYTNDNVNFNYIIKPNFISIKKDFKNISQVISAINLNKFDINKDLKKGKKQGIYEGIELNFKKHILKQMEVTGDLTFGEFSLGNIILHTHQDEILLEEGFLREIIRRIQQTRKEYGLSKNELIKISFEGSDMFISDLIEDFKNKILKKIGASEILPNKVSSEIFDFDIKGKSLMFSISQKN